MQKGGDVSPRGLHTKEIYPATQGIGRPRVLYKTLSIDKNHDLSTFGFIDDKSN